MKYLNILFTFLIFSCVGNKKISEIEFNHISYSASSQTKMNYKLSIPIGYKLTSYKADGEPGLSNEYWYNDSSVIYITDFGSTLNEANIIREGYTKDKFEFSMKQDTQKKDTLILNGKNTKGLYWKEMTIGKVSFGYVNVSAGQKQNFDKCIESVTIN